MAVIFAAIIAAIGIARALAQPLDHDVAWFLFVADRVVSGARMYVDVIEINPPLIVWLSIPAVAIERMTGVGQAVVFPLLVAGGAILSWLVSCRLAMNAVRERYGAILAPALALVLLVLPWPHWGQREHVMLILCMPHLVSAAVRMRTGSQGAFVATGIAAGIGYALKPHFALCFVAVELLVYIRTRRVWPIQALVAAVGVACVLLVLVITPEYFSTAWTLRKAYSGFVRWTLSQLVTYQPLLVPSLLSLGALAISGEGKELRSVFGVATAAWITSAVLQGKGFDYHILPALAGALLLLLLGLLALASRVRSPRGTLYVVGTTLLLALAVGLRKSTPYEQYWHAASLEVQSVMESEPVMVLTTDLGHVWPAVTYAGASWPARAPSLWPFLGHESGYGHAAAWAIEALDQRPTVLAPHTRWNDALRRLENDGAFRRVWTGYVLEDSLEYFRVYRWKRPQGPGAPHRAGLPPTDPR